MNQVNNQHKSYWDDFYSGAASAPVPTTPSAYAKHVQSQLGGEPKTLVDVGFGTARDSLWFAKQGHQVIGLDFSNAAVEAAKSASDALGLTADFRVLDLGSANATAGAARQLQQSGGADLVYGRFLIHSLETEGRHNFIQLSAAALKSGGSLFMEFRTGLDKDQKHIFGDDHFRVNLDPELVTSEVEARGGKITSFVADYGLAVYKDEDPHVARISATWCTDSSAEL